MLHLYPIGASIALPKHYLKGDPAENSFSFVSEKDSTFIAARIVESAEEYIKISPLKNRTVMVTLKVGLNLCSDVVPLLSKLLASERLRQLPDEADEIDRDYFNMWTS